MERKRERERFVIEIRQHFYLEHRSNVECREQTRILARWGSNVISDSFPVSTILVEIDSPEKSRFDPIHNSQRNVLEEVCDVANYYFRRSKYGIGDPFGSREERASARARARDDADGIPALPAGIHGRAVSRARARAEKARP